ncbi:NANOG neighbor homeobox [Plecturocebus cupreus]
MPVAPTTQEPEKRSFHHSADQNMAEGEGSLLEEDSTKIAALGLAGQAFWNGSNTTASKSQTEAWRQNRKEGKTLHKNTGFHQEEFYGQAWWITPVIPALWEAKAGRSQCQEIETIMANMLFRRLRQENCLNPRVGGYNELRSCHCTPAGQQSKTWSQKKKKSLLGATENSGNILQSRVSLRENDRRV